MNFYVLTLFPEMVLGGLNTSILGRAAGKGLIGITAVDIRDYSADRHRKVDDYPYGGGAGMLMQAQPVFDAYKAVLAMKECIGNNCDSLERAISQQVRTVYVTPQGEPFTQKKAAELSREDSLIFLCGHYEGIDERVLDEIVTDYISIGDYVLTGGELPAMVMIDAIARLVPGVLSNKISSETETFHNDLLEYPQYTRPEEWHGRKVPPVLLSGDRRRINSWRLEQSEDRTARVRPDLYEQYRHKQEMIRILSAHKRDNIHMIECLRRGAGEVLYAEGRNILVYDVRSRISMMTAPDEAAFRVMLPLIPKDTELYVTSQEYMNSILEECFGVRVECCCYQACYTRREALPVKHKDIRPLEISYLDYVVENYHNGSLEYVKERLEAGVMYGAFVEDRIAGFIGMHEEGSMGMLFVEEAYRRMGLGRSLEAYAVNRMLEKEWIPYCQVYKDNEASLILQRNLGLYLSDHLVWWLESDA